jgi:hypothetical protein
MNQCMLPLEGGAHEQERDGLLRLVAPGAGHAVPQPVLQQRHPRVLRAVAVYGTFSNAFRNVKVFGQPDDLGWLRPSEGAERDGVPWVPGVGVRGPDAVLRAGVPGDLRAPQDPAVPHRRAPARPQRYRAPRPAETQARVTPPLTPSPFTLTSLLIRNSSVRRLHLYPSVEL